MNPRNFFAELKRRNVYKGGGRVCTEGIKCAEDVDLLYRHSPALYG